ncbi:MAG TPA: hypothetical protein VIW70_00965 [Rubrivivax sp.]
MPAITPTSTASAAKPEDAAIKQRQQASSASGDFAVDELDIGGGRGRSLVVPNGYANVVIKVNGGRP